MIVAVLVPDKPPVMPPVTIGADQLYNVPLGTIPLVLFTGVALKVTPLQVVAVIGVITAVGFKVNVKINDAPTPQLTVVGVMVYVADCCVLVGLLNKPLIVLTPVADAPPVIPPVIAGTDQLYVVPAGTIPLVKLVGVAVKATPLHAVAVIALMTALGFTVTVTANTAPVQLPVTGVTK